VSGHALLPASELPPALSAGISLVKEGDFEAAVVELDGALGSLEAMGATAELARGYLFLGIAYLELDQEGLARGKFARALEQAPDLRLDPSEFSPQVIRVFEATRPEAPRARTGSASGPEASSTDDERAGSSLPLLLLGAAGATGLALASDGAPPPGAAPSPSPTPPPGLTPTPHPTPACSYRASPRARQLVDDAGAEDIVCNISAPAGCAWNAVSTNPNWLVIFAGARGTGSDEVRLKVRPNQGDSRRTASIQLVQDDNAFCRIDQDHADKSSTGNLWALVWSSELQVAGGAGRISVDGLPAGLASPGRSQRARSLAPGVHRIEALLSAGKGQPGVWRFRFHGTLRPGSLRLLAGEAAGVSSDEIVFRLRGVPGERIAFELAAGS
jgi:hypothetical protein